MPIFDLILVLFLGAFVFYGFYVGILRMILNLISSLLAIIISVNIYLQVYNLIPFIGFGSESLGKILSFILVLAILAYLLGFVFKIIAKLLKIISSLPIISSFNRILGGILGFLQGLFILGMIIFVMSRYAITNEFLNNLVSNSDVAPVFMKSINWLSPLVPQALRLLDSVI
ncbi:MAG: CvpA family protein [Patescibacteria group bacterium]|jgi:uncharacterized membrane protein required for colicin V production|nr:CvpA family protein [Patescibacteria group bacterium]